MTLSVVRDLSEGTEAVRMLIFMFLPLFVIADWLLPLPLPLLVKPGCAVLIIVAALYHFWCRCSSGSVFAPEFPRPVVILFNWGFGTLVFLFLFQLLLDGGVVVAAVVKGQWLHIPPVVRIAAGGFAGFLAAFALVNALRVPPVEDVTVVIPGLDKAFDGYTLLQLSDLHISRLFPRTWTEAVTERANAAQADMIVITGDFIDGSVAMRRDDIAPLSNLSAPDGVLAVPGNHEYFFDYDAWMKHLSSLGFKMLLNSHDTVKRGDARLVIAGVTDRSASGHYLAGPDPEAALAGKPADAPVVLLDHQPGEAHNAAERGVALQLSGHTHGGMLPLLSWLVARGNNGFVSRRYQIGGMTLYVSNGTGLWPGFALRLGVPSEMTRFRLRCA